MSCYQKKHIFGGKFWNPIFTQLSRHGPNHLYLVLHECRSLLRHKQRFCILQAPLWNILLDKSYHLRLWYKLKIRKKYLCLVLFSFGCDEMKFTIKDLNYWTHRVVAFQWTMKLHIKVLQKKEKLIQVGRQKVGYFSIFLI